jgi:hypothetical protein
MELAGKIVLFVGSIILTSALTFPKIPQKPRVYMGLGGFTGLIVGGMLWLFSASNFLIS